MDLENAMPGHPVTGMAILGIKISFLLQADTTTKQRSYRNSQKYLTNGPKSTA